MQGTKLSDFWYISLLVSLWKQYAITEWLNFFLESEFLLVELTRGIGIQLLPPGLSCMTIKM